MNNLFSQAILSASIAVGLYWLHRYTTTPSSSSISFTPSDSQYVIGYITAPSITVAETLAKGLIEHQYAACVNIIPSITSVYRWEGKVETGNETLLMLKTIVHNKLIITNYIKKHHEYSVPEIIYVPIDKQYSNPEYLQWITDSTIRMESQE